MVWKPVSRWVEHGNKVYLCCNSSQSLSLADFLFFFFHLSTRCHREWIDLCSIWCRVVLSRARIRWKKESMQKKETLLFFRKCRRKKEKKHESLLCYMRNRMRTTDRVIKRIQKPDTVLNMWNSFHFGNVCETFYHCRINFSSMLYRWIPFVWIALCAVCKEVTETESNENYIVFVHSFPSPISDCKSKSRLFFVD